MRIKCPYCKTGFDVPDDFIPPEDEMLGCPGCHGDFFTLPSGLTRRATTGGGSCSANEPEIDGPALQDIPGQPWTEPFTGMEFIWVPGGTFGIGDMFGDGDSDEKPVHTSDHSTGKLCETHRLQIIRIAQPNSRFIPSLIAPYKLARFVIAP